MRSVLVMFVAAPIGAIVGGIPMKARAETAAPHSVSYTVYPVGWVRKLGDKTYIEIDKRYRPALMGVERLQSLWVLYWFDRNDTPQKRSILQVRRGLTFYSHVAHTECGLNHGFDARRELPSVPERRPVYSGNFALFPFSSGLLWAVGWGSCLT